jgi:hypothetical protein
LNRRTFYCRSTGPSSFLGALENPELEAIGRMLDDKIDAVILSIKAA